MQDNQVWDLVPLPDGKEPIRCKWIFKTKRNSEGNVKRYKTHLVAKGKALILQTLSGFIKRLF